MEECKHIYFRKESRKINGVYKKFKVCKFCGHREPVEEDDE